MEPIEAMDRVERFDHGVRVNVPKIARKSSTALELLLTSHYGHGGERQPAQRRQCNEHPYHPQLNCYIHIEQLGLFVHTCQASAPVSRGIERSHANHYDKCSSRS